ncbi:transporter [Trichlorobacter thiogenes]|uniref:transporter n=1 Tax=Trichlorobacter thiogenes TaxID=115783 RepID=UPI00137AE5E4|nr:transporter [Trichlorobacter thiogenes]
MHSTHEMNQIHRIIYSLIVSLVILLAAVAARAENSEHRLGQGVSFAAGIGAEVSHGDYGSNADATVVTLPVLLAVNPTESIDLTLELPMVFLTSKSGSGVVVTQSGGGGRGRRPSSATTTTTAAVTTTATEAGLGDISLSAGWTVLADGEQTPKIRPTLYLKAPTGDKEHGLGTGTFEGGPGVSVSKWLGDIQLFAEGAYIFQDSTSDYQGKNYVSYSAGGGVQATDRLFVSLYAKGSSSRVDGGTAPVEGRVKLNFLQSRRMSWELYALAGFTDASPAAGGGMLLMYQF